MKVPAIWSPAIVRARSAVIAIALALLAPVAAEAATAVTITWTRSADPSTAGYYVFCGTQSGNYTSSINVGNTTSAVIYLPDSQDPSLTYYFAVQAYSTTGQRGQLSSEIVFRPSSQAPTLRNPGNMTGVVGVSVSVQITATDPRGLPLTYSAGSLPSGLSISSNTGRISGTPTTAGSYDVTVAATNTDGVSGTQLFTWTITGPTSGGTPTTGGGTPTSGGTPTGGGTPTTGGGTPGGGGSLGTPPSSGGNPGGGNGGGGNGGTPPPFGGGTPGNGLIPPSLGGGNPGNGTTPGGGTGGNGNTTNPVPTQDITPPTLRVTSPGTDGEYRTTNPKMIVTGEALDNVGVLAVIWTNDRGGAGTSLATSQSGWATAPIDLKMGKNTLTITATDAAGNVETITFSVTRFVDLENHLN